MASSSLTFLLFTLYFASISSIKATSLTKPIILPVKKDPKTLQYYSILSLGTPSYTFNATIDLGSSLLWFNCDASNNKSTTYRPIECGSSECKDVIGGDTFCQSCKSAPRLGCYKNTCAVSKRSGGLWRDNIAIGAQQVPNYLFACGAQGMLGLGYSRSGMVSQISSTFNVPPRFALCAPSSAKPGRSGAIVFAGGPYYMTPHPNDVRELFQWTFVSYDTSRPSEYFISVSSIKIDGKSPFTSFSDKASISTIYPYTVLRSDVYNAILNEFVKSAESKNITKVATVAPFGACFDSKTIRNTKTGPAVPLIDLVLPYRFNEATWRIFGANSMVRVQKDVMCLGFVDGGSKARTWMVIGGHQLEDNLLEFDLGDSRLGFSSSLLLHNTRCSHLKVA